MGRIATYLPPVRVHPRLRLHQMWMSMKHWRQAARQGRPEVRFVRSPNLTYAFFHRTADSDSPAQPQHGHGSIRYLRPTLLTSLIPQSPFRSRRLLVRSESRQLATGLLHFWSESTFLRPVGSFEDTHSRHHMQKTIVEQPPEENIATVMDRMRLVFRMHANVVSPPSTASRVQKEVLKTIRHSFMKMTQGRLSSRIGVNHHILEETSPSISFKIT